MTPEQIKELTRLQKMLDDNGRQSARILSDTKKQVAALAKHKEFRQLAADFNRARRLLAKATIANSCEEKRLWKLAFRLENGINKSTTAIQCRIDILSGRLAS